MIVIAILPFVLVLAGLLTYVLSSNAKVSELGRLAFFAGLLALALALSGHVVRLG
jgi:Na+/phosphate symporter